MGERKERIMMQGLPKLIELGLLFIVLMLTRLGGPGVDMLPVGNADAEAFAHFVVYGYFFIILVQIVGIIFGEELNVQNLIYISLGVIFFLSLGALQIANTRALKGITERYSNRMAMGAFCIITSCFFIVDLVVQIYYQRKIRNDGF